MEIITSDRKYYNLHLQKWDEQAGQYGCDIFNEVETDFPQENRARLPGADYIVAFEADVQELIDFWTREVDNENNYGEGIVLELTEEERKQGDSFNFWYTTVCPFDMPDLEEIEGLLDI